MWSYCQTIKDLEEVIKQDSLTLKEGYRPIGENTSPVCKLDCHVTNPVTSLTPSHHLPHHFTNIVLSLIPSHYLPNYITYLVTSLTLLRHLPRHITYPVT